MWFGYYISPGYLRAKVAFHKAHPDRFARFFSIPYYGYLPEGSPPDQFEAYEREVESPAGIKFKVVVRPRHIIGKWEYGRLRTLPIEGLYGLLRIFAKDRELFEMYGGIDWLDKMFRSQPIAWWHQPTLYPKVDPPLENPGEKEKEWLVYKQIEFAAKTLGIL